MGRFNLLDEPWISVFDEKTGKKKDISILGFFKEAGNIPLGSADRPQYADLLCPLLHGNQRDHAEHNRGNHQ